MKNQKLFNFFLLGIFIWSCAAIFPAQTKPLIKRTTYKTESIEFRAGGTVSIVGAPNGSVIVEGWQKNEIEVSADIQMQAETETDLARLAQINSFVLAENFGHVSIVSVGTHDKNYLKRVFKKLPKNLLEMPFRIDYRIKVPSFCRLEIDGGRGDLSVSKVDGAMRINFLNSNAKLDLIGGTINTTFGSGNVDVAIQTPIWHGGSLDVQMANGTVSVELLSNLDAEINAKILRTGHIENAFNSLKPRSRTKFTEKLINAKAGKGGALLSFTIGDGTIKIQGSKYLGDNMER